MCGVIGAIGKCTDTAMRDGVGWLLHRGIRSQVQSVPGGGIGHVRLPIVGLDHQYDQPVEREDWTIAFVGEILDFKDYEPEMECDIDLVADTWHEYSVTGYNGFRKFDGFWSVVAHNRYTGHLHGMTDYLSQKPLYYRSDEHAIAIASEPDAVACLGPTLPDEIYLSAVLKWGYCPEIWRTPYNGIKRTVPGEHVELTPGGKVYRNIVDWVQPVRKVPANVLRGAINEAVRIRVQSSDVPVAALVSGGLDSAIVYTLAQRYGEVHPYHVENNEREACAVVAPDADVLTCDDVKLEEALGIMQEPIDLGSLIPQVALSRAIAAADRERVCLTGDGADEFFGGYGRAQRYDSQASDVAHELVGWHLPRLDRVMMRNCIEVRSPFLARSVVGIAMGLPWNERKDKKILRDLFRDHLPAGVADRPKLALRTKEVEQDREGRSRELVQLFREEMGWL